MRCASKYPNRMVALLEDGRFFGVDVFGRLFSLGVLLRVDGPAGEADDVARLVADWEHEALGEGVVYVPVCVADFDESGLDEYGRGFRAGLGCDGVEFSGRGHNRYTIPRWFPRPSVRWRISAPVPIVGTWTRKNSSAMLLARKS